MNLKCQMNFRYMEAIDTECRGCTLYPVQSADTRMSRMPKSWPNKVPSQSSWNRQSPLHWSRYTNKCIAHHMPSTTLKIIIRWNGHSSIPLEEEVPSFFLSIVELATQWCAEQNDHICRKQDTFLLSNIGLDQWSSNWRPLQPWKAFMAWPALPIPQGSLRPAASGICHPRMPCCRSSEQKQLAARTPAGCSQGLHKHPQWNGKRNLSLCKMGAPERASKKRLLFFHTPWNYVDSCGGLATAAHTVARQLRVGLLVSCPWRNISQLKMHKALISCLQYPFKQGWHDPECDWRSPLCYPKKNPLFSFWDLRVYL